MIEKKEFGSTGHISTRLLFGAAAFYGTTDPGDVSRTMDIVEEAGINHIDTAESYGQSQLMLGPYLKHNRQKYFLATKTKFRSYQEARDDLRKSLDLLQVDSVDLWQMHCLAEEAEWTEAGNPETGAIRAFIEARDEGLVRFLGVTSHGMKAAAMMGKCLNDFPFDSVMCPYNYSLSRIDFYEQDFQNLLNSVTAKGTAFQIIKTACRRPWPDEAERKYNTWYEPLTDQEDLNTAIGWAMSKTPAFINSAADIGLLPKIIAAAQDGQAPVADQAMAELAAARGMSNLFVEGAR